jgi:beta-N-acetylhexosaminidase
LDAQSLSLEALAGQRLMVGFDGTSLNSDLKYLIDTLKVGGIIIFSRNIGSPAELSALCKGAQSYSRSCGQPPLLIAIDQEGGQVARLKKPFTEFEGNPAMKGEADADHFTRVTAEELHGVGINMNYAPVLDVAPRGEESIMAGRVFGHDPQWVATMGAAVIRGMQERGIMAVAKHFPGIGRTVLDSHLDLPTVEATYQDLDIDLIPFRKAIACNVAGIMLSHIRYLDIDSYWPASLSPVIARDLLRGKLNYTGVVMTDDLDMGAVTRHFGFESAISQALESEIDQILICHRTDKIESAFELILQLCARSDSERRRAEESVVRILSLKQTYLSRL